MTQSNSIPSTPPKSIFSIQTDNVRALEKAWEQGNRLLNESLRSQNQDAISIQTKLMALLFSSYTEAIFSKLIHTPHALTEFEINSLKSEFKSNSYKGWVKCLKVVVNKITTKEQPYKDKVIVDVTTLLQNYIKEPSEVRNRMAHGQWITALNKDNTRINEALSTKIRMLDIITLTRYKNSFTLLSLIIEDLIESPNKAHINTYQDKINKFNQEQIKMSSWTLAGRINKLKPKPRLCVNCKTPLSGNVIA